MRWSCSTAPGTTGPDPRILREEIGGKVIVRTGRRIPGVVPLGGVHAPISVVRMAVGDAYGAKEWREGEGDDEVAFRTERIERRICHAVAEFSFRQAERTGAKVFGGPKYTVSPTYEGMLKEEMDEAAARHPEVPYEPQLIDATFALLISSSGAPMVIPALNRDGDILSDLVLPLFGSIAGSESLLVAFGDDYIPSALMAEAAHGTAPALEGKDVAKLVWIGPPGPTIPAMGTGEKVYENGWTSGVRHVCSLRSGGGCPASSRSGGVRVANTPPSSRTIPVRTESGQMIYSKSGYDVTPLTKKHISELAKDLTPSERQILLDKGTERAFCGTLLDNKKTGVYVCRLCGLPLFSSDSKFHSGTGWPSFFQPVDPATTSARLATRATA